MKPARSWLLIAVAMLLPVALAVAATAWPASAGDAAQPLPPAARSGSAYTGNYCASCHSAADERLLSVLAWNGGIARAGVDGCPAATRVREEVYYTERLLLAVDRARGGVGGPGDAAFAAADARIDAARQGYGRLLDMRVTSLDAFIAEAQGLRYQLGKVYTQLNDLDAAARRNRALLVAVLVTLALLVTLGWGWRNTLRLSPHPPASLPTVIEGRRREVSAPRAEGNGSRLSLWERARVSAPSPRSGSPAGKGLGARAIVPLALVLVLFALPVFRPALPPLTETDDEGLARLAALDIAGRAQTAADRSEARAWLMGRVAAAWGSVNPAQAGAALAAARSAAANVQAGADALWGEAQAVREGAISFEEDLAKAGAAAGGLETARGRAWGIRLAAADWLGSPNAAALLDEALASIEAGQAAARDLDLRGLAASWAGLDPARALTLARQVEDPALRAWALRELAARANDRALYSEAAEAARQPADPLARARALVETAGSAADPALHAEAAAAASALPAGPARAFLLADLAVEPQSVDPAHPAPVALAYEHADQAAEAWEWADRIADPFERSHAQAAIAVGAGRADLARRVSDRTLRDRALRDLAAASHDPAPVNDIVSPYFKIGALVELGDYATALEAAGGRAGTTSALRDFYPLRNLAVALAGTDPASALALVDRMDREADRAAALSAVAAATGDEPVFRRALDMALAARVRSDPAAPVEASLALGRGVQAEHPTWADAAYAQAFDVARNISVKYK